MSKSKKRVPEVRFKGFTDNWEQRRLGEIYTERKEKGNDSLEIFSVSIHHGVSDEELDSNVLGKKVRRSEDKTLYKHVYFGDLVFNMMRAWQGAIGVVKSEGMVSPAYITAIPSKEIYPLFMDYCLRRDEMINQLDSLSYGVTDFRKRLYWDSFIKVLCRIPSVTEQENITAFFAKLDNLIALHQRKLDKYEQLKKGFMQVMFPQKGEMVPRLRFTNFHENWDKRLANTIFYSVSDKNHPKLPILSASQEKGMIYRDDIGLDIKYDEKSTKTYKRVLPGQFVIHLRSFQGGFAYSNLEGITSPAYTVLDFINKENNNILFWKYVLTSRNFIKRLEAVTFGIRDGRSISFADFSTLKFIVPSYMEQLKIGTFFKQIDDTIELHQTRIDKLNSLKKAYLQKMFI